MACTGKDFEMFRLENIEHVQTFSGELPIVLFPKVATYAEDGSVLVVGTDRGHASIFNVSDGDKIQDLPYTTTGLVQSVAVSISFQSFFQTIYNLFLCDICRQLPQGMVSLLQLRGRRYIPVLRF